MDKAEKIAFFVVIGLASPFLAFVSEGPVLQFNLGRTPGMYVDDWLFPTREGLATLGRSVTTWVTVDSLLWFLFLWQVAPRGVRALRRFRDKHSRHLKALPA
jgi:hypothetical protein